MCMLMTVMCVCVCVAGLVCMCVFVCVPCGSRGRAEGIVLTDVTVSLYAFIQTRHH